MGDVVELINKYDQIETFIKYIKIAPDANIRISQSFVGMHDISKFIRLLHLHTTLPRISPKQIISIYNTIKYANQLLSILEGRRRVHRLARRHRLRRLRPHGNEPHPHGEFAAKSQDRLRWPFDSWRPHRDRYVEVRQGPHRSRQVHQDRRRSRRLRPEHHAGLLQPPRFNG